LARGGVSAAIRPSSTWSARGSSRGTFGSYITRSARSRSSSAIGANTAVSARTSSTSRYRVCSASIARCSIDDSVPCSWRANRASCGLWSTRECSSRARGATDAVSTNHCTSGASTWGSHGEVVGLGEASVCDGDGVGTSVSCRDGKCRYVGSYYCS